MALEFRIRPLTKDWLVLHRARVEECIRQLGTFVRQPADAEFWLRDRNSASAWEYDVRLFVEDDSVFVEVSSRTRAFRDDVRRLYEELRSIAEASLEDCDDPDEPVEASDVFR